MWKKLYVTGPVLQSNIVDVSADRSALNRRYFHEHPECELLVDLPELFVGIFNDDHTIWIEWKEKP